MLDAVEDWEAAPDMNPLVGEKIRKIHERVGRTADNVRDFYERADS